MASANTSVLEEKSQIPQKEQRYKNVVVDSKRKYSGYFLNQKKDGKGREEDIQKQTIYDGYFKEDMYHGEGILYQELTKCYFKGMFEANKKKAGIEIFPNGDIYEGEYKNGKFHGKGYLRNCDLFFGVEDSNILKNEVVRQQATYSYQGDFIDGRKHGFGKEVYIKGSTYIGEFRNNQRHGKGKLTFLNESYYEGDFVNGMPCGFGVHVAFNSEQIAQIKPIKLIPGKNPGEKNRKLLEGIRVPSISGFENHPDSLSQIEQSFGDEGQLDELQSPDLHQDDNLQGNEYYYEGEFIDGYKHGIGRLYFPDGSYYYGEWRFNMKVGQTIYYDGRSHRHCIFKYKNPSQIRNHFEQLSLNQQNQQVEWIEFNKSGYPPKQLDGYKSYIDECAISGEQFEDDIFRSIDSNLGIPEHLQSNIKKTANDFQFLKIRENDTFYFEGKDLFEVPISPNQLIYNDLSDYQLISCIEALTTFPHIFFKIFTLRYDLQDIGYIILKLYIQGKWEEIIIDDIIPFYNDSRDCIFSTTFIKDIGWIALQKTFCKIYDSFFYHKQNTTIKLVDEYFQMLSGLPVKTIEWNNEITEIDEDQQNSIWNILTDPNPSCKVAYVQERFCKDKDLDFPPNYCFIVLEPLSFSSQVSSSQSSSQQQQQQQQQNQQQQQENSSNLKDQKYLILKSIDPSNSRIAKKSFMMNEKYQSDPKILEAIQKYSSVPIGYEKFERNNHNQSEQEEYFKYKEGIKQSIFALDFKTFCHYFGSLHSLVGVNQNFQSSVEIKEDVNTQVSENRFFFSFSLNLPAKILINIEQHIKDIQQDLPIRIVLAEDKTGTMAKRVDGDLNSSFDNKTFVARNKKEFLRRKFLNKIKVKKDIEKVMKSKSDIKQDKDKSVELVSEGKLDHSISKKAEDRQEEDMAYLKKKYYNLKYVFGKGQFKKKNIFKNISLSEGNYILMVQLEGPDNQVMSQKEINMKEFSLRLVVSIFGDNLYSIFHILPPDNFIHQVYDACIHQAEKQHIKNLLKPQKDQVIDIRFQKSDLGDRENGSDKIIICQYYLHEEGTYLQLLDNRTFNKKWRQKLYFITENMKIFESNDNNKVDVNLEPQGDELIIIQQVKGLHYHLEGGEGVCLIENISKQSDSEGDDVDDV